MAAHLIQIGVPSRDADFLGDTISAALAAAGSTQGTATALTSSINQITTSTAATADGVKLPDIGAHKQSFCIVRNESANSIDVFPFLGQGIDALGINVAQTLATLKSNIYVKVSDTGWLSLVGA